MAKTKTKTKIKPELIPQRIKVSELRIGMEIVVKTGGRRKQDIEREMKLFMAGKGPWPDEGHIVKQTTKVATLDLCPSQWRTHVHVNESDCYDTRTHVRIAVPKEDVSEEEEASGKYMDA